MKCGRSGVGRWAGSVTRCAHVDFAAESQRRRSTCIIEIEHNPLTLAQHAEHRAIEGTIGDLVIGEIGIAHDQTLRGGWVIGLDDSLHGT